jgi:hypothetical protein
MVEFLCRRNAELEIGTQMNTSNFTSKVLTQKYLMTGVAPDGSSIEYKSHEQWEYVILTKGVLNKWLIKIVSKTNTVEQDWARYSNRPSSRIEYALVKFNKIEQI